MFKKTKTNKKRRTSHAQRLFILGLILLTVGLCTEA